MTDSKLPEYEVTRTGRVSDAAVRADGANVGSIHAKGERVFMLESNRGSWLLDPRVHGEIRPFSMRISGIGTSAPDLTIRNGVFFHDSRTYMMTGIPEDVHPKEHLLGRRYISRLDNFPFSDLEGIDHETWGRLKRHRGVTVGTMERLRLDKLKVELAGELEDIGLPLSATAYLLYSTG